MKKGTPLLGGAGGGFITMSSQERDRPLLTFWGWVSQERDRPLFTYLVSALNFCQLRTEKVQASKKIILIR